MTITLKYESGRTQDETPGLRVPPKKGRKWTNHGSDSVRSRRHTTNYMTPYRETQDRRIPYKII